VAGIVLSILLIAMLICAGPQATEAELLNTNLRYLAVCGITGMCAVAGVQWMRVRWWGTSSYMSFSLAIGVTHMTFFGNLQLSSFLPGTLSAIASGAGIALAAAAMAIKKKIVSG